MLRGFSAVTMELERGRGADGGIGAGPGHAEEAVGELAAGDEAEVPVGDGEVAEAGVDAVEAVGAVAGPGDAFADGVADEDVFHVEVGCVDGGLPEGGESGVRAFEAAEAGRGVVVRNDADGVDFDGGGSFADDDLEVAELLVLEELPGLGAGAEDVAIAVADTLVEGTDAAVDQIGAIGDVDDGVGGAGEFDAGETEDGAAEIDDQVRRAGALLAGFAGEVGRGLEFGGAGAGGEDGFGVGDFGVFEGAGRLRHEAFGDGGFGEHEAGEFDEFARAGEAGGAELVLAEEGRLAGLEVAPGGVALGDDEGAVAGGIVEGGRGPVGRIEVGVVDFGDADALVDEGGVLAPGAGLVEAPVLIGAEGSGGAGGGGPVELGEEAGAGVAGVGGGATVVIGEDGEGVGAGAEAGGEIVGVVGGPAGVGAGGASAEVLAVEVEDVTIGGGDVEAGGAGGLVEGEGAAGHEELVVGVGVAFLPDETGGPVAGVGLGEGGGGGEEEGEGEAGHGGA